MSREEILKLIPHRPPMLLVDEILESDETSVVCQKTFHADEYFFQGHYPEFAIVPGVILVEACCQAGAVLVSRMIGEVEDSHVPVLTRVDKAKFKKMVRPGDVVKLYSNVRDRVRNVIFLSGKVTVGAEEELAVRFDFACALAPKSQALGG